MDDKTVSDRDITSAEGADDLEVSIAIRPAVGTASSQPGQGALIQCCPSPEPYEVNVNEESYFICLTCNKKFDPGRIYAAMWTEQESSSQQRTPATDRHKSIDDSDADSVDGTDYVDSEDEMWAINDRRAMKAKEKQTDERQMGESGTSLPGHPSSSATSAPSAGGLMRPEESNTLPIGQFLQNLGLSQTESEAAPWSTSQLTPAAMSQMSPADRARARALESLGYRESFYVPDDAVEDEIFEGFQDEVANEYHQNLAVQQTEPAAASQNTSPPTPGGTWRISPTDQARVRLLQSLGIRDRCYESDDSEDEKDDHVDEKSPTTFHKFMDLPKELRKGIYALVLRSDKTIAPHLCDQDRPGHKVNVYTRLPCEKGIKFHDDNQKKHDAVFKMLAITRVSRQVRSESLPVFYNVNIFDTVADTPTYFSRLQQLSRFHMIRHVNFEVRLYKGEQYSQKVLRMLLQHIEEEKTFEQRFIEQEQNGTSSKSNGETAGGNAGGEASQPSVSNEPAPTKFYTDDVEVLKSHPQHIMGGLEANFLVLRMLSSTFQDGAYSRKLVMHVPVSTLFDQYNSLIYFPSVCDGLGIQLQLISGREVDMFGSGFRLSWEQKYQRKDFTESSTVNDDELDRLTKRVQALYPNIDEVPRPARRTYYRRKCKTEDLEWFSIDTVGGGIWGQYM